MGHQQGGQTLSLQILARRDPLRTHPGPSLPLGGASGRFVAHGLILISMTIPVELVYVLVNVLHFAHDSASRALV